MNEEKAGRVCCLSRREFGKSALLSAAGTLLGTPPALAAAGTIAPESVGIESLTPGQPTQPVLRKVGGFRCADLVPFKNDAFYDLYTIGYWSYGSFRMDIWKRHGVPFWYPRGAGNLRVAGPEWRPPSPEVVSSSLAGAVAKATSQASDDNAACFANDGDPTTFWYAGDDRPNAKLWIEFPDVARIKSVQFLGWETPERAPKDYSVGAVLPDNSWHEVASVRDEKRMGQWISFTFSPLEAKGIYIDVRRTREGIHGPAIYELRAEGNVPPSKPLFPSQLVIFLGGIRAEEVFLLGHVGSGFDTSPDATTPVGEYVVSYENHEQEIIPLIAGSNIADFRYGNFVPEAQFAFGLRGLPHKPGELSYHLEEMVAVEPKKQLLTFSHMLGRPDQPLKTLAFRCSHARAMLFLAAVTLRQSGPRMNALIYNGRVVRPYPEDTPDVEPSPVQALVDRGRSISLDGDWKYELDPGNLGLRRKYFAAEYAAANWKTMPIPSQWYTQGIDYHGVVWFRRNFDVPEAFPGSVMELNFGGVDYDARVWINGQFAGRHIGAFSSFKLEATGAIRKGQRNEVVVRVDSPIDPGFTPQKTLIKGNSMDDIAMPYDEEGCMGGIFRPVTLTGRGPVGIENVWTVSKVGQDLQHAEVAVKFELRCARDCGDNVKVRCRLKEPEADNSPPRVFEAARDIALTRPPLAMDLPLAIDRPLLWYPWEQGKPHLHILEIEVWQANELLDRHISRVGIREVGFTERHCVLINHHRVFLKGMLNDDIHWMSLMDRKGYGQRIQLQKDANLNIIRMVGHQSSPDMYDLCDAMGMMIWQEMPLQWGYSATEPIRKDILKVVEETVVQCRPHAAVVGWSAWNEGGQLEFSDKITALIKSLDSTRPMTKACGAGDFDTHIYPNLDPNLHRRTPLWSGVEVEFVSETGAYGFASLEQMKEIIGEDLFPFDSADYFWDVFNSYRYEDGPVFLDAPRQADWPTAKIRAYALSKIEASERWFAQYMKFQYENSRGLRFAPTNALIHCRFDDAFPSGFYGSVVTFTGRPRKAYFAAKEACQQVLPILFLDYTGAEDIRVVNEYWTRAWQGLTLKYDLQTREGKTILHHERKFDLPPDSTVKVMTRDEAGDIWHVPGGFLAALSVIAPDGTLLAENHYDLTQEEVEAFVTSVYPPPPVEPVDSIVLKTSAITSPGSTKRVGVEGTYSKTLMELDGKSRGSTVRFAAGISKPGDYLVRVACNSGEAIRSFQFLVDGRRADLESYPYLNASLPLTRRTYSSYNLAWYPGWRVRLSQGEHQFVLELPHAQAGPSLILDAVCLQYLRT